MVAPMGGLGRAPADAASLLGQSADLGTIEVGKFADIIAVAGDPYRDVTVMEQVSTVIKDGRIIIHDGKDRP